ncbi:MAG: hypothetical protein NTY12_05560 [Candidatus Falkowbacteria bacterium]|nr:hypothetical protein [Candidatus Falkowbacteria bacterium]
MKQLIVLVFFIAMIIPGCSKKVEEVQPQTTLSAQLNNFGMRLSDKKEGNRWHFEATSLYANKKLDFDRYNSIYAYRVRVEEHVSNSKFNFTTYKSGHKLDVVLRSVEKETGIVIWDIFTNTLDFNVFSFN